MNPIATSLFKKYVNKRDKILLGNQTYQLIKVTPDFEDLEAWAFKMNIVVRKIIFTCGIDGQVIIFNTVVNNRSNFGKGSNYNIICTPFFYNDTIFTAVQMYYNGIDKVPASRCKIMFDYREDFVRYTTRCSNKKNYSMGECTKNIPEKISINLKNLHNDKSIRSHPESHTLFQIMSLAFKRTFIKNNTIQFVSSHNGVSFKGQWAHVKIKHDKTRLNCVARIRSYKFYANAVDHPEIFKELALYWRAPNDYVQISDSKLNFMSNNRVDERMMNLNFPYDKVVFNSQSQKKITGNADVESFIIKANIIFSLKNDLPVVLRFQYAVGNEQYYLKQLQIVACHAHDLQLTRPIKICIGIYPGQAAWVNCADAAAQSTFRKIIKNFEDEKYPVNTMQCLRKLKCIVAKQFKTKLCSNRLLLPNADTNGYCFFEITLEHDTDIKLYDQLLFTSAILLRLAGGKQNNKTYGNSL